jgi:hypothetical protein
MQAPSTQVGEQQEVVVQGGVLCRSGNLEYLGCSACTRGSASAAKCGMCHKSPARNGHFLRYKTHPAWQRGGLGMHVVTFPPAAPTLLCIDLTTRPGAQIR